MGHYTRIQFAASLGPGTPAEVEELFSAVAGGDIESARSLAPAHPFFQTGCWMGLLRGTYAAPSWPEADGRLRIEHNERGGFRVELHSSFKHYDEEIRHFCNWISPYIANAAGEVVGEFEAEDELADRYGGGPTKIVTGLTDMAFLLPARFEPEEANPWSGPKMYTLDHPPANG